MTTTLLALLYLLLWDPPATASDAFALAVALAVCFSAGFALVTTSDAEIKLYELLEELEK